jgi:hypothetical protein
MSILDKSAGSYNSPISGDFFNTARFTEPQSETYFQIQAFYYAYTLFFMSVLSSFIITVMNQLI